MSWVLVALSSGSAGAALWWAIQLKRRLNFLNVKYSRITDFEEYILAEKEELERQSALVEEEIRIAKAALKEEIFTAKADLKIEIDDRRSAADQYIKKEEAKLKLKTEAAEDEINSTRLALAQEKKHQVDTLEGLREKIANLWRSHDEALEELETVEEQLALAKEDALLTEYGFYEPKYDFEVQGEWEEMLLKINDEARSMIGNVRNKADVYGAERICAGYIQSVVSFNGSIPKGISMQKATIKLLLRAFNGECSSFVAKVNYKNVKTMEKRVMSSFEAINKIGMNSNKVKISSKYRDLRLAEIGAVYEYEEWKQREKEEQARIREQIREEERAERELEKAKREAEKEAKRNADALAKARSEVEGANEKQKVKLLAQIAELERRMQEMEEKNRYISQAMLTKTGHVYIISNVGSFGDDMLKIGMTRRLEPMDRVKELGDASVPFPFDVHAMIRTSDAPSLENALHKHFDARRVNLENTRKEFFYVTLEEIQQELDILKDELNIEADIHITMAAEAKQWRMSEAKRKHLERSYEN